LPFDGPLRLHPVKGLRQQFAVKDNDMMLNWNDYRKQLAVGVKEIGQLSPDAIKGYIALSAAGQKTDLLGAKVRELITLAVAVTLRCDGCITVHTEAAIKRGATREEIAEALGVATTVNAGAALVYSARVMDAFKEYPSAASPREPDSLANLRG
jgi:AhpD family alkylhydroperoxidase